MSAHTPDMIIVGAGLSGLMTAWRCLDVNPDLKITIIDAADHIGGDHTWSFNLSDIEEPLTDWIKPFIAYQWPRYEVRFPKRKRTLDIPYCTGNSDTLRACVQPFIDEGRLTLVLNSNVSVVEMKSVTLESGDVLTASCVLDARGFKPNDNVFLGYQKFVGLTVRTKLPHGLKNPVIMDATVAQLGGYRFVYCLPFSETEILVEDTYYTDGDGLSEDVIVSRIKDYIAGQGWEIEKVTRQEKGVLPITLAVDAEYPAYKKVISLDDTNQIGIRGGFYHAVTGYSLPDSVYLAYEIAGKIEDGDLETLPMFIASYQNEHFARERFFRLLNRMLFRAAKAENRYKVLQRFYGLPQSLIERFYRGAPTSEDKRRILIGKPPVPLHLALYNFSEKVFIKRERAKRTQPHE